MTGNENQGDYAALVDKIDALSSQVELLVEHNRRQAEFIDEMMPIARAAMDAGIERLAELEEMGVFRFGQGALRIAERVVENYGEEDLDQLGDAIVGILDTVKNLTQPDVLEIANEAADVLHDAGQVKPVGMVGVVKATQEQEVQQGLAVLLEVMRHIGKASKKMKLQRGSRRLDRLAPSRKAPVRRPQARKAAPKPSPAPEASAEAPKVGPPVKLDGVDLDSAGFLVDPAQWSEELAPKLAANAGIALTDAHWQVIRFARKDWQETGVSPNIRRITTGTDVSTKELYALFPKAPAKTMARCAGIPKPAGCL